MIIKKMQAVTTPAVTFLPAQLSPKTITETMIRLGFDIKLTSSASDEAIPTKRIGYEVAAARHQVGVAELDKALSRSPLSTSDKLMFKAAADRMGIIKS